MSAVISLVMSPMAMEIMGKSSVGPRRGIGIVSTDRCKFKLGLEGDFLAQHFSIYLDVLASKINVDLTLRIV